MVYQFFVAVMKEIPLKAMCRRKGLVQFMLQGTAICDDREGMGGQQSRKLANFIFIHTQEEERENCK